MRRRSIRRSALGVFAILLAAPHACTDDTKPNPGLNVPDASLSTSDSSIPDVAAQDVVAQDTSTADVTNDVANDVVVADASDAGGDVILGCIPQEVSTRYDATWLFGTGCRADWNTSNQVTFSVSPIVFSGIEGTVVASNPFTGALFAASDGVDIYDGTGSKRNDASLGANVSASQPVAFMGKPGSATDFYVVTNSANSASTLGLFYSTLACGSVAPTGAPTAIPNTGDYTEALATVRHANDVDRWLLSAAPAGIAVIPVTASGFGSAVITAWGATLTGVTAGQRAFIAFARDRKTFAITAEDRGIVTGTFDNATGAISNLQTLTAPSTTTLYSAAFSPDAKLLYVSQFSGSFHQIDIATNTNVNLGAATGALRLGIDDKIYLAKYATASLSVVTNPNTPAMGDAAALVIDTITLPSGCTSSYGLPAQGDL